MLGYSIIIGFDVDEQNTPLIFVIFSVKQLANSLKVLVEWSGGGKIAGDFINLPTVANRAQVL